MESDKEFLEYFSDVRSHIPKPKNSAIDELNNLLEGVEEGDAGDVQGFLLLVTAYDPDTDDDLFS